MLVILFAAMGLPWLGRRIVATLMGRSRPVGDAVGTLALSGLAAVMIGLTALYEILLLSDANATLLIGGPHRSVFPSPSSPHPWRPCRSRARRAHGCADRPGTAVSGWDQAVPGAPGHGARSDDAVRRVGRLLDDPADPRDQMARKEISEAALLVPSAASGMESTSSAPQKPGMRGKRSGGP